MNPEAVDVLNKILAKTQPELTEDDKAFLRARVSYISKIDQLRFKDVFEIKKSKKEEKEDNFI